MRGAGAGAASSRSSPACRLTLPRAAAHACGGRRLCSVAAASAVHQPSAEPPAGKPRGAVSAQALAMAAERLAVDDADAPRDPAAAAAYKAILDAEEEAGLYEEPVDQEEVVEVDATAQPDDSLAVRDEWAGRPTCRRLTAPHRLCLVAYQPVGSDAPPPAGSVPHATAVQLRPVAGDAERAAGARH